MTPVPCHNGHPFEPGVDIDDPGRPDPSWCNVCGESRYRLAWCPRCRVERCDYEVTADGPMHLDICPNCGSSATPTEQRPAPEILAQRQDGAWVPAEPIPFHYGALARLARWVTRGRWPA